MDRQKRYLPLEQMTRSQHKFMKSVFFTYVYLLHFTRKEVAGKGTTAGYDCSDIWDKNNVLASGVYEIKPVGAIRSFQVFCDMTDGGWTVIQRHNGEDALCFDRNWEAYKLGFGSLKSEHWLGLDNIHLLTSQTGRPCELCVSLGDFSRAEAFALYSFFIIGSERDLYQLSVGSYSGNAGDGFRGQDHNTNVNGSFFSTKDKDNDRCSPCIIGDISFNSCSNFHNTAGWFRRCAIADLNGYWMPQGQHLHTISGVFWKTWRFSESLRFSILSLRCHV